MIKVAYMVDKYPGTVSDVSPTGKWRIINRKNIEIEVRYTLASIYVISRMWLKKELATKRAEHTTWLPEHKVFFTEIAEFDCNENK